MSFRNYAVLIGGGLAATALTVLIVLATTPLPPATTHPPMLIALLLLLAGIGLLATPTPLARDLVARVADPLTPDHHHHRA